MSNKRLTKVNTQIDKEPYKELRKLALDLEIPWSKLLEQGVKMANKKYQSLVEDKGLEEAARIIKNEIKEG